jgi:viroplasmin and RNaseH domain-containing protein
MIYVHLSQVYRSMMAKKWYAVYVGHVSGVYDEWPECQAQVYRFLGGSQKGFDSRMEAEASYLKFIAQQRIQNRRRKNYYIILLLLIVIALLSYVIV